MKQYKVDVTKAESLEDIKNILKHLDLYYTYEDEEAYEELKHMLIEVETSCNGEHCDSCGKC